MKKKHASRRKLSSNSILLTVAALALCALPAVALAADCIPTTNWTGASGSWFVEGNWSSGVPNSGKSAYINNAGTADINTTGAAACNLTLGYDAVQSGKVSVAGGRLAVTNEVEVGAFGKGTLIVTNGGTVSAGLLTIAALLGTSDSVGTVTVDGGTFIINTRADVGGDNGTPGGIGLMTVKNSGSVTAGNLRVYSSGTLTGNGTVSTTSGTTIDGTLKPNATLTISGNLTFTGTAATMQSNVVPTGADNVQVSATASLNGRLAVTMTGTFTPGTQFTFLHASGGLSGAFSSVSINYPTNQCFSPQINYDYVGNHVYLYLAPTCW
jgi:T5SS/PEP-CTERM-associated repeat protein